MACLYISPQGFPWHDSRDVWTNYNTDFSHREQVGKKWVAWTQEVNGNYHFTYFLHPASVFFHRLDNIWCMKAPKGMCAIENLHSPKDVVLFGNLHAWLFRKIDLLEIGQQAAGNWILLVEQSMDWQLWHIFPSLSSLMWCQLKTDLKIIHIMQAWVLGVGKKHTPINKMCFHRFHYKLW